MTITFEQAEREYYEPPDDKDEECERCGNNGVLVLSKHQHICQECMIEIRQEEELLQEEEEEE